MPESTLPPNIRRVWNPPNPFLSNQVEWLDAAPPVQLEIYEEHAKTVINKINSPDVYGRWSVNPYRGCFHGCAYCFARPTHQYLGLGAGTDFERKIVAKVNAPEQLRKDLSTGRNHKETIMFSGVTDCYQPLEASYELTRRCLQACCEFSNPVVIITKGALIARDIDVLQSFNGRAKVQVAFSIAFSDDEMSKLIEPSTPRPSVRFRAMEKVAQAGIPVSVGLAPIIPGLNDSQIPEILKRAKDCGARHAFKVLLRLPSEVKDVFLTRLQERFPLRYEKVVHQLRLMRGGALYQNEFGTRMRGSGPRWDAIEFLFNKTCQDLGLNERNEGDESQESAESFAEQLPLI